MHTIIPIEDRGFVLLYRIIVYLEKAWSSKQMITEGEPAILLETTQSQSKQRSTLTLQKLLWFYT